MSSLRTLASSGRDRVQNSHHTTTPEKQISWANVVLTCSDAEAFGRATVEALKSGSRSSAREVGVL